MERKQLCQLVRRGCRLAAPILSLDKSDAVTPSKRLLDEVAPTLAKQCVEIIQSSFNTKHGTSLLGSENGFVYTVRAAYNGHHHLTLRPEDVWFAILTQLSTYINKHAEELRGQFVAHEGQKELKIEYDTASRYDIDMGSFAYKMGVLLSKNLVDKELRNWVMPSFSTTTLEDTVITFIIMMGSMQKYFKYVMHLHCGIPTVTLLGTKADWQTILHKLDKLKSWGAETTQFKRF